jgi:hypothetical protein
MFIYLLIIIEALHVGFHGSSLSHGPSSDKMDVSLHCRIRCPKGGSLAVAMQRNTGDSPVLQKTQVARLILRTALRLVWVLMANTPAALKGATSNRSQVHSGRSNYPGGYL